MPTSSPPITHRVREYLLRLHPPMGAPGCGHEPFLPFITEEVILDEVSDFMRGEPLNPADINLVVEIDTRGRGDGRGEHVWVEPDDDDAVVLFHRSGETMVELVPIGADFVGES